MNRLILSNCCFQIVICDFQLFIKETAEMSLRIAKLEKSKN